MVRIDVKDGSIPEDEESFEDSGGPEASADSTSAQSNEKREIDSSDIDALNELWAEATRLANAAASTKTEEEAPEDETTIDIDTADLRPPAWPPGTTKNWPPEEHPDPFIARAKAHEEAADEMERVPLEESTEAGVVHGGIDQEEIEQLMTDLAKAKSDLKQVEHNAKENLELAQRKHAELINYRNRMKQEAEVNRQRAVESLVTDLIPVLDSMEKALGSIGDAEKDTPLATGLRRTFDLFSNVLARFHVERFAETGIPFDPAYHSPVYFQPTNEVEDGTVLEIYQSGYMLAGKLIRPAMVKVSRCEESEGGEDSGQSEIECPGIDTSDGEMTGMA